MSDISNLLDSGYVRPKYEKWALQAANKDWTNGGQGLQKTAIGCWGILGLTFDYWRQSSPSMMSDRACRLSPLKKSDRCPITQNLNLEALVWLSF
ncbi:hypothetical protein N7468_003931 [Penicillium chermesinum]|uniref:Uncharacterized protein n=1 Tax=Penicillium chermesinum TaxID=63820 RepID=A0A9W9P7N3_9EURO|nr:uncharacterized protein N7468_003931 [Penicillium chermesinum]KAJ5239312.1 hypothetical protein N7468_003931 [Penicillium chermesinum]